MFVLLGIGEKAGSGADVILHGWDDNKWAHPVIEEKIRPDRVVLTLGLEAVLADISGQQTDNKRATNGQQTDNKRATTEQILSLELMKDGDRSIVELMSVCKYKKRESFRKSVLNEMIDNEWVSMTHPENANHRNQRYYITELGRNFLENK